MLQSEQIHLEEWLWLFWHETNFYSFSLKSLNTRGVFKKQSKGRNFYPKIVNGLHPLTIFANNHHRCSIRSENSSDYGKPRSSLPKMFEKFALNKLPSWIHQGTFLDFKRNYLPNNTITTPFFLFKPFLALRGSVSSILR